jgi:hypothetical protein
LLAAQPALGAKTQTSNAKSPQPNETSRTAMNRTEHHLLRVALTPMTLEVSTPPGLE